MQAYLARSARFVDRAVFPGRLFLVAHYPGAVPSSTPGELVHGDVFRLHDPAEVLGVLDAYEECGPEGSGAEYYRQEVAVTLRSGRRLDAWLYLYGKPTRGLRPIPGGDYLEQVARRGAAPVEA